MDIPDGLDGDITALLGRFVIGSETSQAAAGRSLPNAASQPFSGPGKFRASRRATVIG